MKDCWIRSQETLSLVGPSSQTPLMAFRNGLQAASDSASGAPTAGAETAGPAARRSGRRRAGRCGSMLRPLQQPRVDGALVLRDLQQRQRVRVGVGEVDGVATHPPRRGTHERLGGPVGLLQLVAPGLRAIRSFGGRFFMRCAKQFGSGLPAHHLPAASASTAYS